MDFNRHRLEAARDGRRLWMLYGLAVVSVVAVFNGACWLIWRALFDDAPLPIGFWSVNVLATAGLTVGGSLIELSRLDRHPNRIALRLGARLLEPAGHALRFDERRLVNVVEEMALAARQPVPRIYVLEREPSINALATGLSAIASAIIVTDGALAQLTRDELQGVVAHEIAHIASGDVAVSTRVAALNAGLELVSDAGRHFGSAGVILLACGFTGHLAAMLISAAMSRNREFHADALAVELTREPGGLARALRKVWWIAEGASRSDSQGAGEQGAGEQGAGEQRIGPQLGVGASKLTLPAYAGYRAAFFDTSAIPRSALWATWLRTHPPLRERITRLLGYAAGPLVASHLGPEMRAEVDPDVGIESEAGIDSHATAGLVAAADPRSAVEREAVAAAQWLAANSLPPLDYVSASAQAGEPACPRDAALQPALVTLIAATQEASDAAALAMLLVTGAGADETAWPPRWRIAAARQQRIASQLRGLPTATIQALRWPLLERCAASLRGLADPWPRELLVAVRARIELDQRVTLSEWIYYMLLRVRIHGETPAGCRGEEPEIDAAQAVRWVVMLLARASAQPELRAQRVANDLVRAAGLTRASPMTPALDLGGLQTAIASLRRVPMLQRPLLMRGLVAFLPADAPTEARDFVRVLALVIDTPLPHFPARSAAGQAQATFTRVPAIPAA